MSDRSLPIEPADGPERVLVRQWLEQVVVGLNLCPFARGPWTRGEIRVVVCRATDNTGILRFRLRELIGGMETGELKHPLPPLGT